MFLDEKRPCDCLEELLECIVMQSSCHVAFTFQASKVHKSERGLTCLKTGLLHLAGGQSTAPLLKMWVSINLREAPIKVLSLQAPEGRNASLESYVESYAPRTPWKGETDWVGGCPTTSSHTGAAFLQWKSVARWRLGRALGWIICEPYCSLQSSSWGFH